MIEDLKFFKDRVELAGPDGMQINRVRAQDRTVTMVKKWQSLNVALKAARAETMTTLSAKPGKAGAVVLEIADKPRFDALQAAIAGHEEQITALEEAARKLDEMGGPWFSDLNDQVGGLGRVEVVERRQIANMTAGYIQRRANSGQTPEQILSADPEFQRLKNMGEATIKDANEKLLELRPKLEQINSILKAVGC